ncbi:Conserved_hypothetical protein [Hexamita inflata]|uniref:Uncharacterized protein n=1 Tax=Hexamita inflata TaxID=28002 RepID=A0AA86NY58_9EUKA|nr:Conserved hypothetical protein [Hexamita inflata]
MNSQLFTNALRKYLLSQNITVSKDALQIWKQLDSMDNNQKRGIWQHVGKTLNIDRASAQNYFHNTWAVQFFDSVAFYRKEIKQMVLENLNLSNQELVQKFMDMFPNKNFSKHNLQQVVYIQKQRLSDSETHTDGYSIDISNCVRFQDAISK